MAKVRTTITIDEDQLARWQAVADRQKTSLSSTINGWLEQVLDAAEYVAACVDEDRQASKARLADVIRSLQLATELTQEAVADAKKGARGAARGTSARSGTPSPRPVIRGGNSPAAGGAKRGNRHD